MITKVKILWRRLQDKNVKKNSGVCALGSKSGFQRKVNELIHQAKGDDCKIHQFAF